MASGALVLALVLVIMLDPKRSAVQASSVFGGLRTADKARLVRALVLDYWVQDRVTFASVAFTTLDNISEGGPSFARGHPPGSADGPYGALDPLRRDRDRHAPKSLEENPDAVEEMRRAGLGLIVYRLNSERRWSDAAARMPWRAGSTAP
ncbi:MAG: hypothetical protein LH605_11245 [Microbacteriaceae bacterium]|nr:hypothetical protein [Microbacteriaceae bacterium]